MGGKKALHVLVVLGLFVQFLLPFAPAQAAAGLPAARALSSSTPRVALELDGTGDYVRVDYTPALNPSRGITIDAWVYRYDASRCETVVGMNYQVGYWLGFCSSTIRFYPHGTGSNVDGVTPIPARVWTHIAVTYDGTTRRYYVNGELDLESTASNGPLSFTNSDLGIGSDPANGYDFQGLIDHVRIYSYARSATQIRANMYASYADSGLIEEYPFNNDTRSTVFYGHPGALQGDAKFTSLGARRQTLVIGRTATAPTLDGVCQPAEYPGALQVDIGSGTGFLYNTATDLYACISGMTNGVKATAKISIDGLRDIWSYDFNALPLSNDFRFSVEKTGALFAEQGDGAAFVPFSPPAGSWEAAATEQSGVYWSAEFRLSQSLIGVGFTGPGYSFGMLLTESVSGQPEQHAPGGGRADRPMTWNSLNLNFAVTPPVSFTLNGQVLDEDSGVGIASTRIAIQYNSNGALYPVGETLTDAAGNFSLPYSAYPGGFFIIQAYDQPGYFSRSANPGLGGSVLTANIVTFPAGAGGVYDTATFLDSRRPVTRSFDKHYLVVYSAPATFADIYPLIEMKRLEGFRVKTVTTQVVEATVAGRDLAEKVRNWIKNQYAAADGQPVYAVLIGRHDKIPFREVGWLGDLDHRLPGPAYFPALVTDWYYADLDSNWDTDNDGWYGEFLFCAPWVNAVPLSGADLPGQCPIEGGVLREGPYGTSASASDDWSAEVALGRLPLNTREEVRQGILTVVRGEKSGSLVKRKALMAGAFWWYNGRSWNAATSTYDDGAGPSILGAWPGEGARPYGSDNAEYLENLVRPAIDPYTTTITALYETTAPGGDATLSPTNRGGVSSAAINRANVLAAWNNDYGLVNVAGHGNNAGVYNESWLNDFNDNRILENPANPAESTGCTTNCNETRGSNSFIDYDFPNPGVIPAVVYANACLTGDAWKNIPGAVTPWIARDDTLPARLIPAGAVAAWSGLLNLGATNTQDAHHAQYAGDILGKPLLLGDAQWKGNEALIRAYVWDWRRANQDLFGDPAYSYWGNPLDMRAPWPQSGGDWFANGASRLPGPVSARVEWTRSANNPQTSPIVTAGGSIVVGTSSGLAFYRANGTLEASPLAGLAVNFTPVATTDGTYVISGGNLIALTPERTIRWIENLGAPVTGEPRVGPDGLVWVPTTAGMTRTSGSGVVETLNTAASPLPATTAASLGTNGAALWVAGGSRLMGFWMDRDGRDYLVSLPLGAGVTSATMPAVAPNGKVYVGTNNNTLVQAPAFPFLFGSGWTFDADGAIPHRPAVGADSAVYFATAAGSVYAVNADSSLRWRNPLGAPPAAAPLIDENYLYLPTGTSIVVLNLSTGEQVGSYDAGGALDGRSTPVIGSGRTIYVTRADNTLVKWTLWEFISAPEDLRAVLTPSGILLNWQDNSSDESGFRIEFCELTGACAVWKNLPANTTQELVTQLDPTKTYFFRASALGGPGAGGMGFWQDSFFAASDPVTPPGAPPPPPAAVSALAQSAGSVRVTWTHPAPELLTGFTLQRSFSALGPWNDVTTLGPAVFDMLDQGLEADKSYHYRLIASSQGGSSGPSNTVNATTRAVSLPAPALLTLTQDKNRIKLSWPDSGANESGYRIQRRMPGTGGFVPIAEVGANATGFEDPFYELVEEKIEYQVVAFNAVQESNPTWGAWTFALNKTYDTFLPAVRR